MSGAPGALGTCMNDTMPAPVPAMQKLFDFGRRRAISDGIIGSKTPTCRQKIGNASHE